MGLPESEKQVCTHNTFSFNKLILLYKTVVRSWMNNTRPHVR